MQSGDDEEDDQESSGEDHDVLDDFSDDVYVALTPGKKHSYFDRASWLRTMVSNPEYRDPDDGHMMLKQQFAALKTHKSMQISSIPISAKIFRLSFDDHLQHRSVGNAPLQLWFQHLFRQQSVNRNGQVDWHFHPVDYNANIVQILHSLSVPVVSLKSDMCQFASPSAMAIYVAHTFLQPEFCCTRTHFANQCYGFPYLIELESHATQSLQGKGVSESVQKTSVASWLAQPSHRFLIWKSHDGRFWSPPMPMDDFGGVAILVSALKETWPMLEAWISQNIKDANSFGHLIWHNRRERIVLSIYAESADSLVHQPVSDLMFVPMANYNNDRLLLLRDKTFIKSCLPGRHDQAKSINLDDYCAIESFGRGFAPELEEWQKSLASFCSPSMSLAFAMPEACTGLAKSGIPNVAISSIEKAELAPPFCICPEDFDRFVPVPPGGGFLVDANTVRWRSSRCKIVACGSLTMCLDIPLESRRDHDSTSLICKILDYSSLPDHFAVVGASSIQHSLRESLVESSACKFRREIWNHAFIAPHKYIAKFAGWVLYGPMLCLFIEKYKMTFGLFLAHLECNMTRRQKESNQEQDVRFLALCSKFVVRNKRIQSESHYNQSLIQDSIWLKQQLEGERTVGITYHIKILLMRFKQLCDGAAHIHSQGLVHRDLKPSNIMLDDECNVRIIDFECATPISDRSFVLVFGTPRFLPVNFMSDSCGKYYIYDDGSVDVFAIIEMILRALQPVKSLDLLPQKFFGLLNKQRQYLSMHVLVSYGMMDDGMKRAMGPHASKQHEPYIASQEFVAHRKRLLQEAYTATKLGTLIQKCLDKI